MRCASCETENDANFKFCMTCGSPLATPAESDESSSVSVDEPQDSAAPSGEYAQADSGSGEYAAPSWDASPPPTSGPPSGEWGAQTSTPPSSGGASGEWGAAPSGAPPASAPSNDWGTMTPPPSAPEPQHGGWGAPPQQQPQGQWGAPPSGPPAGPAWGGPPPEQQGGWGAPPAGPPVGQWGQQAPGGYPPQGYAAQAPAGPPDPNGLGVAASRLGNRPRKDARAAFAVAGAILKDDEQVEALAAGKYQGNPAVLILTDKGLVLVDDRPWKPVVERIELNQDLQVQGMQDKTATLTLFNSSNQYVVDQIADAALAVELAQRIRYRIG